MTQYNEKKERAKLKIALKIAAYKYSPILSYPSKQLKTGKNMIPFLVLQKEEVFYYIRFNSV